MAAICARRKDATMIDYINISFLNDFIFCPYSIYLHNVYMETDETMYHAMPQTRGRLVHETVDKKTANNRSDVILAFTLNHSSRSTTGTKENQGQNVTL